MDESSVREGEVAPYLGLFLVRFSCGIDDPARRSPLRNCSADFYDSYSDYDAIEKASQPSQILPPPPQQTSATPPPLAPEDDESEVVETVTLTSTISPVRLPLSWKLRRFSLADLGLPFARIGATC